MEVKDMPGDTNSTFKKLDLSFTNKKGGSRPLFYGVLFMLVGAMLMYMSWYLVQIWGVGVDFKLCFYPAGGAVLAGQSPYQLGCFYNPFWLMLLFAPLSLLPMETAFTVYTALALAGYVIAVHRIGGGRSAVLLFLLTPFLYASLQYGNIDWLVMLGAALPPTIGVWLVVLKPQLGLVLLALWAYRFWKTGNKGQILKVFAPVAIALVLSIALGWWRVPNIAKMASWNASIFPWGIPAGLLFTWQAFKQDDDRNALAATPFLSPYLAVFSYGLVVMPFLNKPRLMAVVATLSWLGFLYFRMFVLDKAGVR